MTDIVLTGSKYLIIILFAYFTYISFRAQRDVPDERKKTSYALQRITMLLIHAVAFLTICINISINDSIDLEMGKVIALYAAQLVYLILMSCVIPHFVSLSKGLNNVMCMFLCIGFIMQTRLDFDVSLRQFYIVLVGSAVFFFFVFLCKRWKFMRNMTWLYAAIGMILLAVMLILSRVVYGAKLAIDFGFFSFQPAEFVKILFVLFVASAFYHSNTRKTVLITAAVAAIHVLILVFCHDLGSALILFMIYLLMLYVATKKLLYVGIGLSALAIGGVASYFLFDHVAIRVHAWRDPWSMIDGNGYQIAQALFAIGTGGWFGSGLFGGAPRTVPLVSNDMIYSAISEELGGIFGILLILLCLCFVLMMFRVAIRVNNPFYKLLAFGLGSAYGFQVFLTIGGTTKFIPLTGVNLPFISSGGSSLLTSLIMLGMIQALYVISEADVEREREMIAGGAPISEFEGYDRGDNAMIQPKKSKKKEQTSRHPGQEERIRQMAPEGYREDYEREDSRYEDRRQRNPRVREYYPEDYGPEDDVPEEYRKRKQRVREYYPEDYEGEEYRKNGYGPEDYEPYYYGPENDADEEYDPLERRIRQYRPTDYDRDDDSQEAYREDRFKTRVVKKRKPKTYDNNAMTKKLPGKKIRHMVPKEDVHISQEDRIRQMVPKDEEDS